MAHRPEPFDRSAFAASVAVHVVLLGAAVWSTTHRRPPPEFVTYQIELVSPPPAVQAEEEAPAVEELVVERPEPTPPEPEPEEKTVPVEETKPEPEPEKPPEKDQPAPPEEGEKPREATTTEKPAEEARESGEDLNVRLEGLRRDYPAYYNNIIRQIQRCFRWRGQGNWETTVRFVIHRDGSVSDMDFVKRSGNSAFDFEAMGAVDCAGQGRFGPLPDELPFDRLPVQFNFRPQGGIRGLFPDGTEVAIQ